VLSLLGAAAINRGKLAADKSIARPIAPLVDNVALRKLSTRRLLEGEVGYGWGATDIADWQRVGGWTAAAGAGVRAWLTRYDTWTSLSPNEGLPPAAGRPEDELLAWAIAEASGARLAHLFCEQVFSHLKPEDSALWLTDPAGHELAAGLALSPRDLAKLGQLLLDARTGGKRGSIPRWLIEALLAPANAPGDPGLAGLPASSSLRYGFVRLGGKGSRIALIGPYGNSLYVDFDRRLVIALAAAHPDATSPLLLASLDALWRAIEATATPERPARR
jgi:CubicO group peptidase (beta-lactamase class C family)